MASGSDEVTPQSRQMHGFKWFLVCVSLYISALVFGLDTTIAADVQSSVIEDFGHVDQLAWIGAGFPLGSVAVVFLIGTAYTRFNNKWMYIASLVLFELGSTVCGAAPNMDAIILGRVIAGAGGAGLFLGCLNYFSAMTIPSERGLYISLIGLCWGGSAVLGPIIGGQSIWERLSKLDFLGFVLGAEMWVTFAMAATMAGGQWPWNDGRTIAMWVVFGVLLACYILQQWLCIFTTPDTRSFPVHLLSSRVQLLLCIATAANIAACFCIIYFIPLYFQFVHGDGALMAAMRLLPYTALNVFINLATGYSITSRSTFVFGGLLTVLGSGLLMHYLELSTSEGVIYGLLIVLGVGTGVAYSLGFTIATIKAGLSDLDHAINLQDICQLGSSTIILVIAGQVFQSRAAANLNHVLAGKGYSPSELQGAIAGAQSHLLTELSGGLREEAINAITEAMQRTFILNIVAGVIFILSGGSLPFEQLFETAI
ncbi:major facilitator superfamily domain-containing protein [Trichoderma evansii]